MQNGIPFIEIHRDICYIARQPCLGTSLGFRNEGQNNWNETIVLESKMGL